MTTTEEGAHGLDALGEWRRDTSCGAPRAADIGRTCTLMGWVATRRDHGGIVFIDLRDRTGVVQVVFDPDESPQAHSRAHALRSEWVIAVRGRIAARPAETVNKELATGEVELRVEELRVVGSSRRAAVSARGRGVCERERPLEAPLPRSPPPAADPEPDRAPPGDLGGAPLSRRAGLHRRRDADPHPLHAGGGARLPGAESA
jgi:hypothetical protein